MSDKQRYAVATVQEVREKGSLLVEVKGVEIGIFYLNGSYYAWRNLCPHAAAPVCRGTVSGTRLQSEVYEYEYGKEQQVLRCPWHGWEFDLLTGCHLASEHVKLRGYKVEALEDQLYILS